MGGRVDCDLRIEEWEIQGPNLRQELEEGAVGAKNTVEMRGSGARCLADAGDLGSRVKSHATVI